MDAADHERLQLVYDNLLGLASAGVVTVMPSSEELSEGLAHLGLRLKDDQELSACLWVLEAALGEDGRNCPSFQEFLAMADISVSDVTPPSSAPSFGSASSYGRSAAPEIPQLRLQLQGLLSPGAPSPTAKSFFSSEEESAAASEKSPVVQMSPLAGQGGSEQSQLRVSRGFLDSESDVSLLMLSIEQSLLSELLSKAVQLLRTLRPEAVSKKGSKLLDFLQELLERTWEKAEDLEHLLSAALQSARQCREAVKKSWKQSESVLGRFGKAEAERRKWQEKWTQQCAELEELKKQSAQGAQNLQDARAATLERTWRLGDAFGGAAAIAFAWFRVAAFSAPERKKRLQHLQKVAAQSSLERLRRRMANAREDVPPG